MAFPRRTIVSDVRPAARALTSVRTGFIQMGNHPSHHVIHKEIALGNQHTVAARLLVTATPIHKRRMISQSLHLIFDFFHHIADPFRSILGNIRAGKHNILPYQNTLFIAKVIEDILFVNTAAPNAKHIKVAVLCKVGQTLVFFVLNHACKAFDRYPVAAADKYFLSVDFQGITQKGIPFHVFYELYRAETKFTLLLMDNFPISFQLHLIIIQRMLPVADRPPKLCIFNGKASKILHTLYGDTLFDIFRGRGGFGNVIV